MRAIIVCVGYSDILSYTLPYNRHHFSDVLIVTTREDFDTISVAVENECLTFKTDAFYRNGAHFNKWLALEEGLDHFKREGLLCIMDADIFWPRQLPKFDWEFGNLYTPHRRCRRSLTPPFPPEDQWNTFPVHPNLHEFAGYTQVFYAEDPVLTKAPWHELNWRHAGGADTYFQKKWPNNKKVRPPFHVLHIGQTGVNWCGRTQQMIDGSDPDNIEIHRRNQNELTKLRAVRRQKGDGNNQPFYRERIG